ncbi:hypothetical protein PanWU01x14_129480, partial [Parasponia andersonii]
MNNNEIQLEEVFALSFSREERELQFGRGSLSLVQERESDDEYGTEIERETTESDIDRERVRCGGTSELGGRERTESQRVEWVRTERRTRAHGRECE